MSGHPTRVFTIPSGVDFPDCLAAALLDGRIIPDWPDHRDPLSLSHAMIYLPTRRLTRALTERLAERVQTDAVLLPTIVPLGGLDDAEDRLILDQGIAAFDDIGLMPEIAPARRRVILARLILTWSRAISENLDKGQAEAHFARSMADALKDDVNGFIVASTPRDALQLADALGQLIDTLTIYGKTWQDIHDLVPQDLADEYWKISRNFLEIAARQWPDYCKANHVIDAAERQHRLLTAEADRLLKEKPDIPIIVAGSTGTMPATARLIAAIAQLPRGAVVLPGLDHDLDDISFLALTDSDGKLTEPQHPQAQLKRLIGTIGIERRHIPTLGLRDQCHDARMRFMSEALRPVSTTDQWQSRAERLSDVDIERAFSSMRIVEAQHERDEATAIAIALREALETPNRTAALITPDRALAERVQSELKRWNIEVEDSAGTSLVRTRAGQLAILIADVIANNFSPLTFLALLAHPNACFGLHSVDLIRARRAFDIGLFRHITYPRGLDAIESACRQKLIEKRDHHQPRPEKTLSSDDWNAALKLINSLKSIFADYDMEPQVDLVELLPLLEAASRKTAAQPDDPDSWEQVFGAKELSILFQSVSPGQGISLAGILRDFPSFMQGLMNGVMVRDFRIAHPRIKIFGLLEARLLPVDLAILAGLDESVWPPDARTDPFLNRPWRDALLLPPPERRIGQTAHDLISAMGAQDIILTRALKRSGSPTVPSRFLQRMRAVAGDKLYDGAVKRGQTYLDIAYALDEQIDEGFEKRISQPAPIVGRDRLPTSLSVTRIETLRRDPYAIFAQYVLRLDALKQIEPEIGPSEIGMAFHDALARFGLAYRFSLPENAHTEILRCGREAFHLLSDRPEFSAFWWPRFEEAAEWYLQWEKDRRKDIAVALNIEEQGAHTISLPHGGEFILTARADRIELHKDGTFSIVDYKTGAPPTAEQVRIGLAPQLTLEAAILQRNGFPSIVADYPRDLFYIKIGTRDGGTVKSAVSRDISVTDLVAKHYDQLVATIDAYWNGGRPFASRPIAQFASRYSDYDHLARVKEWAMNAEGDEDGEP